ncbi:MAG: inositol monophosphatase family protein [Pseudomonadota bacterium]
MSALEREGRFWILDPLDGTRNFVRGVDEFATILAFVENGVTKAGWISACPEKTVFSAFRGKGVQVDGADFLPQKQDAAPTLERQHPLTGMKSLSWLTTEWRDRIKSNLDAHHKAVAGHCSAYAYLHLLRGDVDFKISSRIHPWDHLAGALMLDEMGGQVGFIDKPDEFDPYRPMDSVDRPLLAVAPGVSWRETAQSLAGPSPELVTD